MRNFIQLFYDKIKQKNIDWEAKGLVLNNNDVVTLGSDSKLIGRIFELICTPILYEIAQENNYKLLISKSQTVYPDFTFLKSENDNKKIAVDIKTTYRKYNKNGSIAKFSYTLGSYASFMRNNTKNIHFPYDTYSKHYIIGFLYDRVDKAIEGQIFNRRNINLITNPYTNIDFFVQEKYKIAGDKPGSGNTENIGSYKVNNINILKEGKGPFSILGEETFNEYWRNYPKYREKKEAKFSNLSSYIEWSHNKDLEKKYNLWKIEMNE